MTNSQMKSNRFADFAKYRRFVAKIVDAVNKGHTVKIQAGFVTLPLKAKNIECLKAMKNGVFVQRGKAWTCIMDRAVSPNKVWAE